MFNFKQKITGMKPSTLRKWLIFSLAFCLVLINIDFIFHHFGHAHAWQSPLYLVAVSLEGLIILAIIGLCYKKII